MLYTAEEVYEFVREEDVRFIRLAFCDINGRQKNVSIQPTELRRAFEEGISFDASAVYGFGDVEKSDLLLFPNPSTLNILPWRPSHGKVVRMFCDIRHPDGTPFERDSRLALRRAVKRAADMGITVQIGAEFEFYLFKTDENGDPTKTPFDNAGYMDVAPEDKGENVRREICLTLLDMGIVPECSHHEEGPGQNEIDFRYADAMRAADDAMNFQTVVKATAQRNGLQMVSPQAISPLVKAARPLPLRSGFLPFVTAFLMPSSRELFSDTAEQNSSSASDRTKAYGKNSDITIAAIKNQRAGGFSRTILQTVVFSRLPKPPRLISVISLLTDTIRK